MWAPSLTSRLGSAATQWRLRRRRWRLLIAADAERKSGGGLPCQRWTTLPSCLTFPVWAPQHTRRSALGGGSTPPLTAPSAAHQPPPPPADAPTATAWGRAPLSLRRRSQCRRMLSTAGRRNGLRHVTTQVLVVGGGWGAVLLPLCSRSHPDSAKSGGRVCGLPCCVAAAPLPRAPRDP